MSNETRFTVRGKKNFPMHMLSVDHSFPVTVDVDWDMIFDDDEADYSSKVERPNVDIDLIHVGDEEHWYPTFAAWKQRGWKVIGVHTIFRGPQEENK